MEDDIVSISDSDEEAVPSTSSSAATNNKPLTSKQQQQKPESPLRTVSAMAASIYSGSSVSSPVSCFESDSSMMLYKPLGADLAAQRLEAMTKRKLSIMEPFPAVKECVNKMRSALGTNDSQLKVMELAQNYITALKIYQSKIGKCPNRCRLLARHITRTMCLIRDLSRHFIDSPHYSQKICELLAIYIFFELQSAEDFKDSKIKIAERIIHNIHLHLENAQSNFVLRIFAFLSNMGKENEIATKIFQRIIPEPTIMVKNEFPDRLFIQYLIAFYHWKEAWNDFEDQQKVVAFANKFMKPMSTIKTSKLYARHLPCYVRRDDATGYFLTNMVFFNDLRNASILDGIQENGPTLVDLSDDERVFPIVDLSDACMEQITPLFNNIKIEPIELSGTVDLTEDEEDTWIKKLIRRAVALEVILPAILTTRREDQAPAVVDLNDSDNENENANNNDDDNENENENDDDAWAFGPGPRNEQQQQPAENINPEAEEESNSMDEIYNELNSSIDFGDDSTTESEIARKKEQKERFDVASKLTNAQARITFEGVVEKELKAMSLQRPSTSRASAAVNKPVLVKAVAPVEAPTSSKAFVESSEQPSTSAKAAVSEDPTLPKATAAEKTSTSSNLVEVAIAIESANSTSSNAATSNSLETDAVDIEPQIIIKTVSLPIEHVNEEPSIPAIQEVQIDPIVNGDQVSPEIFSALDEQEENTENLETPENTETIENPENTANTSSVQSSSHTTSEKIVTTTLTETQAPKEAITLTIEQSLSSFDSSDESDEDFLGRYQKPPLKTYLRRAYRKPSKKGIKPIKGILSDLSCSSGEDEKHNISKEQNSKRPYNPPLIPKDATSDTPPNVLFSKKVISLREDESSNGGGGATPSYLKIPESVQESEHGSNVVFSLSHRRLSTFPSLKLSSIDQSMPDFDAELSMPGEDDSNSRVEGNTPVNISTKKSNISSKNKKKKTNGTDEQHQTKAKSVWFAEKPQVREIERRKSTSPSPQKVSPINAINSTINKIIETKQHFTSQISSSTPPTTTTTTTKSSKSTSTKQQSTKSSSSTNKSTKSTINSSDSNKTTKSINPIIQSRSNPITTEPSAATAALKSAQEKDLLQQLFPEVFVAPAKPDHNNTASKTPALIKASISYAFNSKLNNKSNVSYEIVDRRKSITPVPFSVVSVNNKINIPPPQIDDRRKSMLIASSSIKHPQSDFDKYLERKKLLPKSPKLTKLEKQAKQTAATGNLIKNAAPKTEATKSKRPRKSKKTTLTAPKFNDDPKLSGQMNPIVVLDRVAGPVFILRSGMSSETYTEVSAGVFKSNQPHPPPAQTMIVETTAKKIPAVRTKSLSDILTDVVVQEITALPMAKENSLNDGAVQSCANIEKQLELRPSIETPVPSVVPAESLPLLQEKEKVEENKTEQRVQSGIVPLSNAEVKSHDELDLKQIKKEEMESKSPSPEAVTVTASKPVSDCFKKPLKSMTSKRLASSSFIHGTARYVQAVKATAVCPAVRQEVAGSSSKAVDNRLEVEEPVTSTNSHLFPPLLSESESDSSCRTERTVDRESSEQSDSSQSLNSPKRTLKVRLRRDSMIRHHMEYSIVSNTIMDKMNSKSSPDGEKKRRGRKSLVKKGEALKRIFEKADSSTSSSAPKNLDQQPPQSGLINGVLVPSIEAMNTPPPTPPTTVDDKNSVTDDTSQEAKSQTAADPSNNNQSHPPAIYQQNDEIVHPDENNIHVAATSPVVPPIKIRKMYENIHFEANFNHLFRQNGGENQVCSTKSPPRQRRRFESVSLPTSNQKRSRKQSTTEVCEDDGGESPAKNTSRCMVKKRRKTICTDSFNPPEFSFDEEICSAKPAADSPTLEVMQMHSIARIIKPLTTSPSAALMLDRQDDDPSSVRLNNEEIPVLPTKPLPDSSLLASTFTENDPSAILTPLAESPKLGSDGGTCSSSRTNCDSPVVGTSRNLAVSRTYSKSNMVQQVFVPPEIEKFIEEPTKFVAEKPAASAANLPPTSKYSARGAKTAKRRANCTSKPKKSRKICTTSEEEEEDGASQDSDYQQNARKTKKKSTRGRKRGAGRGKRGQ